MFPIAPGIIAITLIFVAVIGVTIGLISGVVTSLILRLGRKGFWKDGLLGGVGMLAGLIAAYTVPWPEYIVYTPNGGGGENQETMHIFPYPFLVAYIGAAILPIVRQLYRIKRSKSTLS
jgi:hypothetical protein